MSNDKVCVWTERAGKEGLFDTECNPFGGSMVGKNHLQFPYCPRCGGKIEVVHQPKNCEFIECEDEPVHNWFQLSYSSYLVLPRSVLQSMPVEWQRDFIDLIRKVQRTLEVDGMPNYRVRATDSNGKFVYDPFCDYQRGRRRVAMRKCKVTS